MQRIFGLAWWLVVLGRRRALIARRNHRGAAFLAYTAVAGLGDFLALWWSLTMVGLLLYIGEYTVAAIAAVFFAVLAVRRLVIEHATIPLGLYRTTHLFAEIDRWLGREEPGLIRLTAARALAKAGRPPDAAAWWRSVQGTRVGAFDVAAEAVFADAAGDRDDARALFESLALLREPAPQARELAAEWLALDDAAAGRWQAILDRAAAIARPTRGLHRRPDALAADHAGAPATAGEPLWPATGLTFFLEGVAARMLAHPEAPSAAGLWVRWIESSRRRHVWPLLQRALAAGTVPAPASDAGDSHVPPPAAPHAAPDLRTLAGAITLHTAALTRPTVAAVAAAATGWDAALADAAWRTALARRALTLGAPPDAATRAADELQSQAITDLAAAILSAGVALPALAARAADSKTLAAAAARARAELLARLELQFDRIGGRVHERTPLAPIDEWRSFLAVRAAYTAAAAQGGEELERLAFPHAHTELTAWTVWLWNDHRQHSLSYGMTSWLFERALAVGDAQAIELHGKNAQLDFTPD